MHHKWDAHPNCVVAHVIVQADLALPPDTANMYPQVARNRRYAHTSPDFYKATFVFVYLALSFSYFYDLRLVGN
jgi:hypothetical protein